MILSGRVGCTLSSWCNGARVLAQLCTGTGEPNIRGTQQSAPTQEELRQLLGEALRTRRDAAAVSALPDAHTTRILDAYTRLSGASDKLNFFEVLCRDFGVNREQRAALLHPLVPGNGAGCPHRGHGHSSRLGQTRLP